MNALVPIMLFGWVPFSVSLFLLFRTQVAILITIIGAWLFLPQAGFNLHGLPNFSKETSIAISLIIGRLISPAIDRKKLNVGDIFILVWCFCPVITSLANGLGVYDGLSQSFRHVVVWGIPYFIGRRYFDTCDSLKDIATALVLGGLLYVPLCFYEIRMSPQLSNIVYGFFPHSFLQHFRYDGWRPIVFMQHGLMVALWMTITAVVAFGLWTGKFNTAFLKSQLTKFIAFCLLLMTAVLCKSSGATLLLIAGLALCFLYKRSNSTNLILLFFMVIPLFLCGRISGVISTEFLVDTAQGVVNEKRVHSFEARLEQEDALMGRAHEHFLYGWGGYGRGNVSDDNGDSVKVLDALWLITFMTYGGLGLVSLYSGMLSAPYTILRKYKQLKEKNSPNNMMLPVLLSLVVIIFMIDQLMNGMVNPIYIFISGSLNGFIQNSVNGMGKNAS